MLLVHLHTNHDRTISAFIDSMERSGFTFVKYIGPTVTGTWYVTFRRPGE